MEYKINEVVESLYEPAKECVIAMQAASVSMIQRRFRIGYVTATKIIDRLEENGVIGPYEGSKPREILINE
ncbi:cell division protein FtsK [Bacillus cereus]|nr:cell division protein FtsK [Bacillus cereus]PFP54928.1 cell division protein FtsK [Bacillus cereus]PFV58650.1 cell division protein FtsK [Bacillus cereus]PGK48936.1 cell division protein FtsK [Bacillus cereus]